MIKRRPLWQDISAKILPFSLALFLILSVVQLLAAARYDRLEASARLALAGEQFAQRVDEYISALLNQIESIAENSIVINSLIDLSGRQNYLPLYLETIGVFGNTDISIRLVDFQNVTVDANFFGKTLVFPEQHQWFNQVLTEGRRWVNFDERGLFVAEPVLNHGFTEGAILVLVPIEVLIENFNNLGTGYQGSIADKNGIVLVSLPKANNTEQSTAVDLATEFDVSDFISSQQANIKTRIIQPTQRYFSSDNIFLTIVLQSLALILFSIFAVLLFSIGRVKQIISGMTGVFDKTIKSGDLNARIDHEKWALELAHVGEQFNIMMEKLQSTTTSRDEINTIFDSMNESIYVCDIAYNVLLSNRELRKTRLDVKSFVKSINLTKENAFLDSTILHAEFESVDGNATTLWRKSPLLVNGVASGWLIVGSDISEIRRAQQQMQLLEIAIDSSSNGMIVVDATDNLQPIVFANKSFVDITGFEIAEIMGRKCSFLQGADTNSDTISEIREAIIRQEPVTVEILNYKKDGSPFWNQLSIDPVFNDQRQVTHFLGVIRDISALVLQREELRAAKEAAELAVVAKSEFLATMSHEIRTPMNGVLGMLGLLMKTDLNSEQIHRAKLAQNSAKSLLTVINDILDFSKIEAGKLQLESLSFNLREMLGELAETLAYPAEAKNLEIILDVTGVDVSHIQADSGRIRQIITNLISNSIKFTEQGEIFIQVGLSAENEGWRLYGRVVDSGIGIPAHKQEFLFDAFSQVDASTTREYGGTGLGLAIVRSLCELMNGHIRVMSEVGRGSVFEFDILVEKSPEAKSVKPPLDISGMNILVVDSNQSSLDVLRGQLKNWGANVSEAKTLEAAKAYFESPPLGSQTPPFSMAMIASNRSELRADELANYIRQQPNGDAIRLIGMTAMNSIETPEAKALSAFDFWFPKPVTCADMCNALQTLTTEADLMTSLASKQDPAQVTDREAFTIPSSSRLLVVDDNQINQLVALGLLDEYNLSVDCAANGREALQMLQTSLHDAPYTLVLMDCQMPEMDGFEATRRIRQGEAGERYRSVAIVAMTANAMQGDRERCIDAGMNDYLAKPIESLPLKNKLEQWLQPTQKNAAASAENVLVFDTDSALALVEMDTLATSTEASTMAINPTTQTGLTDDEVWNQSDLLKRVANNDGIVSKLLTMYLADKNARINQLRAAYSASQYDDMASLAHTLKGVSANLSAVTLSQGCVELERALKGLDLENIESLLVKVEAAHLALTQRFEQHLTD